MTAPQDPFATPSGDQPSAGGPTPGYGQPQAQPAGYGSPTSGYDAGPHGGPPYGQHGGFGTPPTQMRNGFGIAALVLGILALLTAITVFGGILFGLLAIVFGFLGRGRVSRREANNGGMAITGIVLGALGLIGSIALIAFGVSILNSDSGRELQDCLRDATTAEQQAQCEREFQDSFLNG